MPDEISLEVAQYHNLTRFAGEISETDLDSLPDGSTYVRVKTAYVDAGKIALSLAEGDLDDIADGTYAKVLATEITAGRVQLSRCEGDADDIDAAATTHRFTTANGALGALRAYTGIDADGIVVAKVKPASVADPGAVSGLYLGSDKMGFFDGSVWKTYMKSDGSFYLGGDSGPLQWDGTDLTIPKVKIQSASADQRIVIDSADNTLKFYSDAGLVITIDDTLFDGIHPGILINDGLFHIVYDNYALTANEVLYTIYVDINDITSTGLGALEVIAAMNVNVGVSADGNQDLRAIGYRVEIGGKADLAMWGIEIASVVNQSSDAGADAIGINISSVISGSQDAYGIYIGTITAGGNAYAIYNASGDVIYSGADIQLDADLEFVGSQSIKSTSNGNITIAPNGSGDITLNPDTGTILCSMDVELTSGKKLVFDGTGGNDYIVYADSALQIYIAGAKQGEWTASGLSLASIDGILSVGNISITQDSAVDAVLAITAGSGKDSYIELVNNAGADAGDSWQIVSDFGNNSLKFKSDVAVKDLFVTKMTLETTGLLTLVGGLTIVGLFSSETIYIASGEGLQIGGTATGSLGTPADGTIMHDNTTDKLVVRLAGSWETITSA